MGQYSKYKLYVKYEYDGENWTECDPTQYGAYMSEENSFDCGYSETKWVDSTDTICSGVNAYYARYEYITYDGETWEATGNVELGNYIGKSISCADFEVDNSLVEVGNCCYSDLPSNVSFDSDDFYSIYVYSGGTELKTMASYVNNAFSGDTTLLSVKLADYVSGILGEAFLNCTSLSSVTLGNGITSIEYSAFTNCTSISSITIPDSVQTLGGQVFENCTSLSSITIGSGMTSVGDNFGNTPIKSIVIPEGVIEIEDSAFYLCPRLSSVTIPSTVSYIGNSAFGNEGEKGKMQRVNYNGTIEQWNSIELSYDMEGYSCWVWSGYNVWVYCTDGSIGYLTDGTINTIYN